MTTHDRVTNAGAAAQNIYNDIKEETKRILNYEEKLVVSKVNKDGSVRKRKAPGSGSSNVRIILEDGGDTTTASTSR